MKKFGIVVARDGKLATVQIYDNVSCLHCDKASRAGACDLCSDYGAPDPSRVLALNDIGAEAGDRVSLNKNKKQKLVFGFLSFIIPVACAFVAYLILSVFTADQAIRSRTALAAFALAMIFAGAYSYKISKNSYDYKIISKLQEYED